MSAQRLLAGGRVSGNREASRRSIFVHRGHLRGSVDEATPREGGSRGKQGFTRGSEATREEMLRALHEAEQRAKERVAAGSA